MGKHAFEASICRPFCMFFRAGEKEEMACRGALVVQHLMDRKQVSPDQLRDLVKKREIWLKHKNTLSLYLCRKCPFFKEDCDFQSASPSDDLEPCGGYIVLAGLMENRWIDTGDLEHQI